MKKFNLEEALAGKPVITRSGRKIDELALLKTALQPIIMVIDGESYSVNKDGRVYNDPYTESSLDLFMAEEEFYGFKEGEDVYILEENWHIGRYLFNNTHSEYIKSRILQGNVFKTREEAEKEAEYRAAKFRLNAKMRELEGDWKADWYDYAQNKYWFCYSSSNYIEKGAFAIVKVLEDWRYSNKETIKWVIENMAEDIKTVLRVE